ncbi:hypothetical protein SDC9_174567 [bioreactor metagenome]|uniref:Uncharacterized protein n=1 Tax=bioreactor metagenome TaxID=1076179 RepID=A0A645GLU8_9ZZZZ
MNNHCRHCRIGGSILFYNIRKKNYGAKRDKNTDNDCKAIDCISQKHTFLCILRTFSSEGPLPHFCSSKGEKEIGKYPPYDFRRDVKLKHVIWN